jgi:Fe-S oxidoreductase
MGYKGEFTKFAENNLEAWKNAGVKTIVTSCGDCYHAFKRLYPTVGSQFKVMHTAEYLDQLIKEGKLKLTKKVPLKVTYHDPCHLGRQGEPYIPWEGKEKKIFNQVVVFEPRKPRNNGAWGIYDAPRNVLKSIPGLQLVEMERIREYAWCCGAGGGVKEAYPDFSNWTANERIEEAKSTGAEAIVSACGWCESNFSGAISSKGDKMQVLDIAEIVQMAME